MTSVGWVLVALVVTPVVGLVLVVLSIVLPPYLRLRWWSLRARRLTVIETNTVARIEAEVGCGNWKEAGVDVARLKALMEMADKARAKRKAALRDWRAIEQRYGL